ncbi:hypothetical protein AVEN_235622-1 [Araneus ventricosus]|uniref:Uncharacterized protein n=1 Tax=Araneus ventricosus TaxID=182803 RepID=A0A4Y2BQP4_ARAVE|nr:hypothetical protein AVEN_235622-1 [Araneus ventricosus]
MEWYQIYFTIFGTLFIVTTFWIIKDSSSYEPDSCICNCKLTSRNLLDIQWIGMGLTGHKKQGFSCSCEEFLVPILNPYVLHMSKNEICQACICNEMKSHICFDVSVSSCSRFVIVVIGLLSFAALTLPVLFLLIYQLSLSSGKHNSPILERYQGYETILDDPEAISTETRKKKETIHTI